MELRLKIQSAAFFMLEERLSICLSILHVSFEQDQCAAFVVLYTNAGCFICIQGMDFDGTRIRDYYEKLDSMKGREATQMHVLSMTESHEIT